MDTIGRAVLGNDVKLKGQATVDGPQQIQSPWQEPTIQMCEMNLTVTLRFSYRTQTFSAGHQSPSTTELNRKAKMIRTYTGL
ncbi:hypothetical protein FKM82_017066 [Ascaphus truei]